MNLSKSQQNALNIMLSGKNVHLFGEAGTGKSTVMRKFLDSVDEERKKTLVMAPTGIAAINIGGSTIHRTLSLLISPFGPNDEPEPEVKEDLLVADRVIIDEISMVRVDVAEYSFKCIALANHEREKKGQKPLQVIVTGDFLQLPPVVVDKDRNALKKLDWNTMIIDMGAYAFFAPMWNKMGFVDVELKEIMRQKDDKEFIENLNKARKGDKSCLEWFEKNATSSFDDSIHLMSRNKSVDAHNEKLLKNQKEKIKMYFADEHGNLQDTDRFAPQQLKLCKDAKVIATVNDPKGEYQNGSRGVVTALGSNSVTVEFDNRNEVEVMCHTVSITAPEVVTDETTGHKKIVQKTIGEYKQIPLKLAWAMSYHKSQGQTFDKVTLHTDYFANGQAYVGLSRATSIKGIAFEGNPLSEKAMQNFKASKYALDFYDAISKGKEYDAGFDDWGYNENWLDDFIKKHKKEDVTKTKNVTKKETTDVTKTKNVTKAKNVTNGTKTMRIKEELEWVHRAVEKRDFDALLDFINDNETVSHEPRYTLAEAVKELSKMVNEKNVTQ